MKILTGSILWFQNTFKHIPFLCIHFQYHKLLEIFSTEKAKFT